MTLALLCALFLLFSGCTQIGPRTISVGRAYYNEAINDTEDEQMLLSIVRTPW
jgi:hypothetical protein